MFTTWCFSGLGSAAALLANSTVANDDTGDKVLMVFLTVIQILLGLGASP